MEDGGVTGNEDMWRTTSAAMVKGTNVLQIRVRSWQRSGSSGTTDKASPR